MIPCAAPLAVRLLRRLGLVPTPWLARYLDHAIGFWRKVRDAPEPLTAGARDLKAEAACYVDAYQCVRVAMLGALLPTEASHDEQRPA